MVEQINQVAQNWWQWTSAMFWQAGLLILLIALIDRLIRKWDWPQVRYGLWSLVLIKLILPPTLSLPTSVAPKLRPVVRQMLEAGAGERLAELKLPIVISSANVGERRGTVDEGREIPVFVGTGSSLRWQEDATSTPSTPLGAGSHRPSSIMIPAGPQLDWRAYTMFIWLLGTATLGVWLLVKLRRLRKESSDISPEATLPESFYAQLDRCAKRLKLRCAPAVVVTRKIHTPAVFGMFRPVLLMPAGYIRRLSRKDTEYLLLHELAHIKRGDLVTHGIYMLLQLVYWYNPLLWLVRRRLRHLRELCCDTTVASMLKSRTVEYRRTLLEAARQFLTTPVEYGLGLVGLFEDSNCLISRINRLNKPIWRHQTMKKLITIITILILFVCVLPMAKAKQDSGSNNSNVNSGTTENAPVNAEKADDKPAEAVVHNHDAEPNVQHESHEQYWQHWTEQMEHWAGQMENWAEHQKGWANSDEFKQWQKDMQEWAGMMQQWAKEMAKMKPDMKNGTAGPVSLPALGSMPAMPPLPSMPANAGVPVLPVITPPKVPSTGSVPAPTPYGTPIPLLPGESPSSGRSGNDVEVKKDQDGKYVATRPMQFVSKIKPGTPLVIRNKSGRIVLHPSKDGKCDVRAFIRGKAATSDEARAKVNHVGMTVNSTEKQCYIEPITSDGTKWKDLNVDLFVTVPAGIEPDIQINMGSVELYDLKGKIKAVTNMGSVKAVNTTGDVELFTKMGSVDFIAPKDLSARLKAQTKMGSIRSDLPLEINQSDMFRKSAEGTVGSGQGNISMATDMGSISLKWYSPTKDSPAF